MRQLLAPLPVCCLSAIQVLATPPDERLCSRCAASQQIADSSEQRQPSVEEVLDGTSCRPQARHAASFPATG